jgi:hypothetical protein
MTINEGLRMTKEKVFGVLFLVKVDLLVQMVNN